MNRLFKILFFTVILILGLSTYLYIKERTTDWGHKVVICVPVYGQSLALGEEAIRITDFDTLRIKYDGRIVNENLNYEFGCYSDKKWKRFIKRLFHDHRRSFELSLYSLAESLASELGKDTIICIFPGGMGETPIWKFVRINYIYPIFLSDIRNAYKKAQERGWEFHIPAVCWMQGESDIIDYTEDNYKKTLKLISTNINKDIKDITHQKEDVYIISYQSNALSLAKRFNKNKYDCIETRVSNDIVDLIRSDSLFWASGPTYPYHFMNERIHIDAHGQQQIGLLEAYAVLKILRKEEKVYGVIPKDMKTEDNYITMQMHVPQPPLVLDTISVKPIKNYGFSVITKNGKDIVSDVFIEDKEIRIKCIQSPIGCKIRYAVNGEKMKSGYEHGPRGNLRDSHPLHNWCYQFDILCE